MNYIDVIEGVKRTESDYAKFADWNAEARSMTPGNPASDWRLVHGVLGLVTEVGELFEAEDIQARGGGEPNYLEEVGDLYWYIFIIADTLGISELVDEILSDNDTWNNEDV